MVDNVDIVGGFILVFALQATFYYILYYIYTSVMVEYNELIGKWICFSHCRLSLSATATKDKRETSHSETGGGRLSSTQEDVRAATQSEKKIVWHVPTATDSKN